MVKHTLVEVPPPEYQLIIKTPDGSVGVGAHTEAGFRNLVVVIGKAIEHGAALKKVIEIIGDGLAMKR